MQPSFTPLKFLILMFAGWISRHQLGVIEYLREENRVLKERLGGGVFVSPMQSVAGLPEKRKLSDVRC